MSALAWSRNEGSPLRTNPTLRALLAVCLFTYVAQNMLNVSIAPLARALALREWVVGLAVSVAALAVTLLSQFWGRRSISWGRRRVLLLALSLALVAGCLFSSAVWLRAAGRLGGLATAVAVVVARGPFFGGAVAAIPPTGQALIAEITPSEAERVRGMSAFSGAVQLSIVVGSVVSSLLGAWSIYAPVHATPLFVVLALLIGLAWIPRDGGRATASNAAASVTAVVEAPPAPCKAPLPPRVSWSDRRVLPWLGAAFGMFFASGVVQIIAGFIVQDRLALSSQQAVPLTAVMLLANAAGAMLSQLVLVPRLAWRPRRLVRVGVLLAFLGLGVLAWAPVLWVMVAATFVVGLGGGMVGPGFTAGGSLAVSAAEQGGVAGVLNATGATTWIFAPVLATALYSWWHLAPFLLALTVLGASVGVAWTSRAFGEGRRPSTSLG
ncbi:MFS transporter [Actinomyces trachealis]|uniref:MFS transporter n=1 Tax=Actinomyces trachealis TaxID=2763540 RepID=UPI001892B909|nr:MFS transporter [Actinomyces trachealis]